MNIFVHILSSRQLMDNIIIRVATIDDIEIVSQHDKYISAIILKD